MHRVLYFIVSLGEQILIHTRQIVPLYFYDDTVANLSSSSSPSARTRRKTRGKTIDVEPGESSGTLEIKRKTKSGCQSAVMGIFFSGCTRFEGEQASM